MIIIAVILLYIKLSHACLCPLSFPLSFGCCQQSYQQNQYYRPVQQVGYAISQQYPTYQSPPQSQFPSSLPYNSYQYPSPNPAYYVQQQGQFIPLNPNNGRVIIYNQPNAPIQPSQPQTYQQPINNYQTPQEPVPIRQPEVEQSRPPIQEYFDRKEVVAAPTAKTPTFQGEEQTIDIEETQTSPPEPNSKISRIEVPGQPIRIRPAVTSLSQKTEAPVPVDTVEISTEVPIVGTTRIVPLKRKPGDGKSEDFEYFYVYYDEDPKKNNGKGGVTVNKVETSTSSVEPEDKVLTSGNDYDFDQETPNNEIEKIDDPSKPTPRKEYKKSTENTITTESEPIDGPTNPSKSSGNPEDAAKPEYEYVYYEVPEDGSPPIQINITSATIQPIVELAEVAPSVRFPETISTKSPKNAKTSVLRTSTVSSSTSSLNPVELATRQTTRPSSKELQRIDEPRKIQPPAVVEETYDDVVDETEVLTTRSVIPAATRKPSSKERIATMHSHAVTAPSIEKKNSKEIVKVVRGPVTEPTENIVEEETTVPGNVIVTKQYDEDTNVDEETLQKETTTAAEYGDQLSTTTVDYKARGSKLLVISLKGA